MKRITRVCELRIRLFEKSNREFDQVRIPQPGNPGNGNEEPKTCRAEDIRRIIRFQP